MSVELCSRVADRPSGAGPGRPPPPPPPPVSPSGRTDELCARNGRTDGRMDGRPTTGATARAEVRLHFCHVTAARWAAVSVVGHAHPATPSTCVRGPVPAAPQRRRRHRHRRRRRRRRSRRRRRRRRRIHRHTAKPFARALCTPAAVVNTGPADTTHDTAGPSSSLVFDSSCVARARTLRSPSVWEKYK